MILDAPIITPSDRQLVIQSEPLLVNARGAAALCGISERLWRSSDSAGRCPEATIAETGVKRWDFAALRRWVAHGCPSRARWSALSR